MLPFHKYELSDESRLVFLCTQMSLHLPPIKHLTGSSFWRWCESEINVLASLCLDWEQHIFPECCINNRTSGKVHLFFINNYMFLRWSLEESTSVTHCFSTDNFWHFVWQFRVILLPWYFKDNLQHLELHGFWVCLFIWTLGIC